MNFKRKALRIDRRAFREASTKLHTQILDDLVAILPADDSHDTAAAEQKAHHYPDDDRRVVLLWGRAGGSNRFIHDFFSSIH
jgi:hypothetical protein